MRKALLSVATILVLLAGYLTLDIFDKVPGFLTLADAPRAPLASPGASGTPTSSIAPPSPSPSPTSDPSTPDAAITPAQVAAAVKQPLASNWLGTKTGVVIRDVRSGQTLFDASGSTPMEPASVTKLLSAWAVSHTMDLQHRLTTRVVAGSGNQIVLVAGGDTTLNPGKGDPSSVNGYAGLGDLATQVATALKKKGRTSVVIAVNTAYAPGPLTVPSWDPAYLGMGYTARIAMLGLSTQRAKAGIPAVADPVKATTAAFAKNLTAQGITVAGFASSGPADGTTLGSVQSAPLVDVLGMALQDSDNAMIESLVRQAAFTKGVAGDDASLTAWVKDTVARSGFDVSGVKLADVCGLADGTSFPPRLLADLLEKGASGADARYQEVMSRLPVGGWNGTMDDRFLQSTNNAGAGQVRAKTGSLTGVSSLAGTVRTQSGRLLVFAIITNGPQSQGPYGARAAIDNVVAAVVSL